MGMADNMAVQKVVTLLNVLSLTHAILSVTQPNKILHSPVCL